MLQECCFCVLIEKEKNSTLTQFAEALQQLTKMLIDRAKQETLTSQQNELTIKKANHMIDDLKASNKSLDLAVKEIKVSCDKAQQRADFYKSKFLRMQKELIQMHKSNKRLSKAVSATDRKVNTGFPFAAEATLSATCVQPVILAPDTCFTDSVVKEKNVDLADDCNKSNSKFQKPSKVVSIYEFFNVNKSTSRKDNLKSLPNLLAETKRTNISAIDLDVTRLDRTLGNDEADSDVEFSIPGSPVLSNKFVANQKLCNNENIDMDDTSGSPSLLPSALISKVSPTKLIFEEDMKTTNTTDASVVTVKKLMQHFPQQCKSHVDVQRSMSPIRFEENLDIKQAILEEHVDNSMDELFNKTDGILMQTHLDSNPSELNDANMIKDDKSLIKLHGNSSSIAYQSKNGAENVEKCKTSIVSSTIACKSCNTYYKDLTDDDLKKIIPEVCRHHFMPSTPNHFWDIGIPSTAECKKRGYVRDEEDLLSRDHCNVTETGFRRRRRKPYQAHFSTKKN